MKKTASSLTLALLASLSLLGACATEPGYRMYEPMSSAPQRIEYGVVESMEWYRDGESRPVGLGAILGGVAGGILGHQIGSGSGNTAATIAGALGGAYAGNRIEKRGDRDRYRVMIRLDNGATLATDQVGEGELRVGDRVRVVNNRITRV